MSFNVNASFADNGPGMEESPGLRGIGHRDWTGEASHALGHRWWCHPWSRTINELMTLSLKTQDLLFIFPKYFSGLVMIFSISGI